MIAFAVAVGVAVEVAVGVAVAVAAVDRLLWLVSRKHKSNSLL